MPGINDTYFAQRLRIGNRPDLFLFFGRHILQGQFRNQSEASFHIYNPHQRFEGITFELERQILMLARRHFTKVDDLITETVAISQHPNVRRNDIFMPDFKYYDSEISEKYSAAKDYFSYASAAIGKMIEIAGKPVYDENGLMKSGVIIRHMVLPSHRKDSEKILRTIAEMYPKDSYLLSLMSQYTPFYKSCEHKEINRRISTYEYEKVAQVAAELGFDGFMQERSSAKEEYTPDFDLSGI